MRLLMKSIILLIILLFFVCFTSSLRKFRSPCDFLSFLLSWLPLCVSDLLCFLFFLTKTSFLKKSIMGDKRCLLWSHTLGLQHKSMWTDDKERRGWNTLWIERWLMILEGLVTWLSWSTCQASWEEWKVKVFRTEMKWKLYFTHDEGF